MVRCVHAKRIDRTELARDIVRSRLGATNTRSTFATFALQHPLAPASLECAQESPWRRHGAVCAREAN